MRRKKDEKKERWEKERGTDKKDTQIERKTDGKIQIESKTHR